MHRGAIFAEARRISSRNRPRLGARLKTPAPLKCGAGRRSGTFSGTAALYSFFSISRSREATFTASEPSGGLDSPQHGKSGRPPMSARISIRIDDLHARAICEEIGERLRVRLRHAMPTTLPPRLQELIDRLAAADHHAAPSIVPSLDDIENIAISEAST
jgi:hypothetical protein